MLHWDTRYQYRSEFHLICILNSFLFRAVDFYRQEVLPAASTPLPRETVSIMFKLFYSVFNILFEL